MIDYNKALELVLERSTDYGIEQVSLDAAYGRILAKEVFADRDLPPFNRATMDGIALKYSTYEKGISAFTREGMARAGIPQLSLKDSRNCIEIATGAILPKGADTVVRYEDLEEIPGGFRINAGCKAGRNIHRQGSDSPKGALLLNSGHQIDAASISVLASVGQAKVAVRRLPKVAILSTGDELVAIEAIPETHQVRRSNVHSLKSALQQVGISPTLEHLPDSPEVIENRLTDLLNSQEVLLLSGGVSRGKYDYLPVVLDKLGVVKDFHRVAQRPGKPFWFGMDAKRNCHVFSFPGNPVSTFLNYHLYFLPWFKKSLQLPQKEVMAILNNALENHSDLTHFIPVSLNLKKGKLLASRVPMNGSGDYLSLTRANAFGRIDPGKELKAGAQITCICFNFP